MARVLLLVALLLGSPSLALPPPIPLPSCSLIEVALTGGGGGAGVIVRSSFYPGGSGRRLVLRFSTADFGSCVGYLGQGGLWNYSVSCYGGSGGGASAIVCDGAVLAVAGGGGGGGANSRDQSYPGGDAGDANLPGSPGGGLSDEYSGRGGPPGTSGLCYASGDLSPPANATSSTSRGGGAGASFATVPSSCSAGWAQGGCGGIDSGCENCGGGGGGGGGGYAPSLFGSGGGGCVQDYGAGGRVFGGGGGGASYVDISRVPLFYGYSAANGGSSIDSPSGGDGALVVAACVVISPSPSPSPSPTGSATPSASPSSALLPPPPPPPAAPAAAPSSLLLPIAAAGWGLLGGALVAIAALGAALRAARAAPAAPAPGGALFRAPGDAESPTFAAPLLQYTS